MTLVKMHKRAPFAPVFMGMTLALAGCVVPPTESEEAVAVQATAPAAPTRTVAAAAPVATAEPTAASAGSHQNVDWDSIGGDESGGGDGGGGGGGGDGGGGGGSWN